METEQEDRSLLIIMALSILGLIDSLYLTYLHSLVAGGGGCPTQNLPGLDCGEVLTSEQAELLGIPVAWFGVLGFIALFSLALDRYLNMDLERTYYNILLLPLTGLIGSAFGIYLTYAEAFIIRQWCPFCLTAFALTLGATFFALRAYGNELKTYIGGKDGV
ncbi:MAG: vitamin K epoxide reductase family protein [Dehalococcoidia bacterium]|nr:vitamin K epoxide reductase family protein [Dehalococcoidia bacterium]